MWQKTSPDADLAFLTSEAICGQQSYAAGIEGCWDDSWAQLTPWRFDVTRIAVPVLLLHGRRDQAVPFSHGQWLAARIPGVETRFYDNEGHGPREKHIGEVHAWLAERF
jgi:pimeloyl-ACP methyl ester carboxylesterase